MILVLCVPGGREVTNLRLDVDTGLTNLTVADVATGERSGLETTQNHPFWDATAGEWVEASSLTPGRRLLAHDEDRLEGDGTGAGPVEGAVNRTIKRSMYGRASFSLLRKRILLNA